MDVDTKFIQITVDLEIKWQIKPNLEHIFGSKSFENMLISPT